MNTSRRLIPDTAVGRMTVTLYYARYNQTIARSYHDNPCSTDLEREVFPYRPTGVEQLTCGRSSTVRTTGSYPTPF
ncbi:MAG: hypothetical protein M3281_10155 [Chloroflexota bacterium]|nr:hypothetical protein [Chloroflexota bacterium]